MTENNKQDEINRELFDHARIANEEMTHIKEDIFSIKTEVSWIKDSLQETKKVLDKFDNRTWTILATIIMGFLIQIIFKVYGN